MGDLFDEFMEYDFTMDADVVKCSYRGADMACSLFFDDEVGCPECGKTGIEHKENLWINAVR